MRRWYWSAIRPGGFPLEYTGTPYEKLLGFLIAVVILAFYLGVVNLILLFFSFSILAAPGAGYFLTFLGVVPLWFFAAYRAQRYLLARTRWMGIRFGLEPGAWAYALRACGHWGMTVLTLGMWHPRLRFALTRFRHERTYFGSQKLSQGGTPTMLYPAFAHLMIGGFLTASTLIISGAELGLFFAALEEEENFADIGTVIPFWQMLFIAVPWLIYGLIHYSVEGRRLMISQLRAGDFELDPRPRVGKVLWIAITGNLVRYFGTVIIVTLGIAAFFAAAFAGGMAFDVLDSEDPFTMLQAATGTLPDWVAYVIVALFYFSIFLIWNVFTHIFLTMPEWRHYAETMRFRGKAHLREIDQRARDESREAGGFAEALDVGAAI